MAAKEVLKPLYDESLFELQKTMISERLCKMPDA